MSVAFKVKGLPEFTATLRRYAELSRRDSATIVNTKAFYIARAACRDTYRPAPAKIGKELSEMIYDFKATAKGARRSLKTRTVYGKHGEEAGQAPIAALLINWQRGKRGEKGLQGTAMAKAIKMFIASRNRARAFLASGWVPAIKRLASLAERTGGAARPDREALRISRPRGRVEVAASGTRVATRIVNEAEATHSTTRDPLHKFGLPALEQAVKEETASMLAYMERKLTESARSLGIRTKG